MKEILILINLFNSSIQLIKSSVNFFKTKISRRIMGIFLIVVGLVLAGYGIFILVNKNRANSVIYLDDPQWLIDHKDEIPDIITNNNLAMGKAINYLALNKLDMTIQTINILIQKNDTIAEYYLLKGYCYYLKEEYSESLRYYDKAIQLNNKNEKFYNSEANVFVALSDFPQAIKLYDKAIDLNKSYANAYFNRGIVYLFLSLQLEYDSITNIQQIIDTNGKNFENALYDIHRSYELDHSDPYCIAVNTLISVIKKEDGYKDKINALPKNYEGPKYNMILSIIYVFDGNNKEAKEYYNKAVYTNAEAGGLKGVYKSILDKVINISNHVENIQ